MVVMVSMDTSTVTVSVRITALKKAPPNIVQVSGVELTLTFLLVFSLSWKLAQRGLQRIWKKRKKSKRKRKRQNQCWHQGLDCQGQSDCPGRSTLLWPRPKLRHHHSRLSGGHYTTAITKVFNLQMLHRYISRCCAYRSLSECLKFGFQALATDFDDSQAAAAMTLA